MRQKTVLVTTYRRDGRPVGTPVSIAVDGDHAYIAARDGREDPTDPQQPQRGRGTVHGPWATDRPGRPGHGPARLDGAEARHAARLLAGKQPFLHGLLVPLTHRLGRARTGKTVHLQLTPSTMARRGDRPPTP